MQQSDVGNFFNDKQNLKYLCEYSELNYANQTTCSSSKYGNLTGLNMTNDNGFVNCTSGSQCPYLDFLGTPFTKPCDCAYNADGIAYCPIADTTQSTDWLAYRKDYTSKFSNSCHSKSRFSCYANAADLQSVIQKKYKINRTSSFIPQSSTLCSRCPFRLIYENVCSSNGNLSIHFLSLNIIILLTFNIK